MKIGVIVAMEKEFVQLRQLLESTSQVEIHGLQLVEGRMGNHEIVLMRCGIGKVNSAIGAVELIRHCHPDLVVSTGVAGGADVALRVMDVVVSTECVYHDVYCGSECAMGQVMGLPATYKSPSELVAKALRLNEELGGEPTVRAGQIVTGDWFVDSREKMSAILAQFPQAMAVDMESCSIAQACHLRGVPFVSFRIISDIPLQDHKAAQYFDFWERVARDSFAVTRSFLRAI